MDRGNHYETAFEAYLRDRRLGYVAVDESRRVVARRRAGQEHRLHRLRRRRREAAGRHQGPQVPRQSKGRPRRIWQNWVEREDVEGLERWQASFGAEYKALLVFAYYILPEVELRRGTADVWVWRGRRYLMRAVPVADYRRHMRVRSPKWGTVHLPMAAFREVVRPLREFTHPHEVTAG